MQTARLSATLMGAAVLSVATIASAQDNRLPDYAPLLPQVKARAWPVDPHKGYVVKEAQA